MADLIVKVDTAVVVPVNIMPLLDDTDFKTIETAVAYNAAGMALTWNFVTPAGVTSGTAVTPTTGGVYDWSEPIADKGMYAIEIPASGGVSINNDTEGVGWFTGVATGVLPWRGPTIQFSPANVVDSLISGSDLLDTNASQVGGQTITCAAPVTVLASVGTAATSTAQTGDSFAVVKSGGTGDLAAIKAKTDNLPSGIQKNVALNNFEVLMLDSTTHAPITGLTVTATRSLDGAAFGACANAVAEVGSGIYKINLDAADLNATVVTLMFAAAGADTRVLTIVTEP